MNIEIKNCKNIATGNIVLTDNRLNIKYAINGTGKSTIAQAIELQINNADKGILIPYKYSQETPLSPDHTPNISFSQPISSIAIFNEDYVNQYIFQPSELIANSFEVFIKTADYDTHIEKIQNLVHDATNLFSQNDELNKLLQDLSIFIAGFGNAQNGYSKTSSIGKGLAKGNKIENIPPSLIDYAPYIKSDKPTTWLAWQLKGKEFLDYAEKCPYCAHTLNATDKEKVNSVANEYDSKYLTELQKMLSVLESLTDYFSTETKENIQQLEKLEIELNATQINYLKEVKNQVITLYNNLLHIKSLNFSSLKGITGLSEYLLNQKVDLSLLSHLNSPFTQEKISPINNSIDNVITQVGRLQGELAQQKALIASTIEKYQTQINGFLDSAGYNYIVTLIEDSESSNYKLILKSKEDGIEIQNPKAHLSYGERNAFALVLFMYRTLKENPDLIVLDDPISSFDKNKKYAIIEKLFKGSGTFQGKTVIMLTHDFDPVIDLIYTPSIKCRFQPQPVASFLQNIDGTLEEKNIGSHDIKSCVELSEYNIRNAHDELNKLIYLRRYYEILGKKGLEWELLSNLFHPGRAVPILQSENNRPMTSEEIQEASTKISQFVPFDYSRLYARAYNIDEMIRLYENTTSGYEKIQLYRLINHEPEPRSIFKKFVDEVYHIENDSLFQLNPSEFPTIPQYIIDLCDNGIALLKSQRS